MSRPPIQPVVLNGYIIIVFGTFGWLGYLCEFGLLALPLILMWLYVRKHGDAELSPFIAPLCLILGITMMDMLLNATLTPLTWLTAGAILGYAEKRNPQRVRTPKFALSGALMQGDAPIKGKRTIF